MSKALVFFGFILVGSTAWSEAATYNPPASLDTASVVQPKENDESSSAILEKEMDLNLAPASSLLQESKIEMADKALGEDQIPVLKEKSKPVEVISTGSLQKIMIGITVLLLMFGGLAVTAKKWLQKNGAANKHTNIRVVTQHHLGPKKSLAIISVAGEFVLLGVTDQNINLIKTLSLMDDEIPEQSPKKFNAALEAAETRPDFVEFKSAKQKESEEGEDGFSIKNLKEVVSNKLRGMKEFS